MCLSSIQCTLNISFSCRKPCVSAPIRVWGQWIKHNDRWGFAHRWNSHVSRVVWISRNRDDFSITFTVIVERADDVRGGWTSHDYMSPAQVCWYSPIVNCTTRITSYYMIVRNTRFLTGSFCIIHIDYRVTKRCEWSLNRFSELSRSFYALLYSSNTQRTRGLPFLSGRLLTAASLSFRL